MELSLQLDIIGFIGCALIVFSQVPQLITIITNKSSKNISLTTYSVLLIAQLDWLIYGVLKNDTPIMTTNFFGCIISSLILISSLFYKNLEHELEDFDDALTV